MRLDVVEGDANAIETGVNDGCACFETVPCGVNFQLNGGTLGRRITHAHGTSMQTEVGYVRGDLTARFVYEFHRGDELKPDRPASFLFHRSSFRGPEPIS